MKKMTDGVLTVAMVKAVELKIFPKYVDQGDAVVNWGNLKKVLIAALDAMENENGSKRKRLVKPTLEEVRGYAKERNSPVDPRQFYDSNEGKGWVTGKFQTPIKDWKGVFRTWEHNAKSQTQETYSEKDKWVRCPICKKEYFRGDKHECK